MGTSCNGGSESQQPIFTLNNATIRNVRINANAADGIHCASGNCRAENVVWEDVCEDAATNKSDGGTFTVSGGSAAGADDKVDEMVGYLWVGPEASRVERVTAEPAAEPMQLGFRTLPTA